ncbi:DUF4185 domain-containing protein [Croceicoccus sediminis]|uniref:DUF4185 domain-containing protein n=1 Tax=Croceicoccus sediminis TaxID=2571150 RepID=UPI00196A2A6E|nr:DUF4185 domain-containing protein [Croceicoccus sediminis]
MHRRFFLSGSAACALAASTIIGGCATLEPTSPQSALATSAAPDAASLTRLGGLGDGYKMTQLADGKQLVVVNDGTGWAPPPATFFSTRLWVMDGRPPQPSFEQLDGYPVVDHTTRDENAPSYYGHSVLAIGDTLYQFLSTLDRAEDRPRHWTGAKLILSKDGGRSWQNADGSSPVRWESFEEQSRDTLMFFDEPGGAFSLVSFLQMGPAYRENRDGFVYIYGLNGSVDGKMNELVLARVAAERIADRSAYEYFAGQSAQGDARWSASIDARQPIHRFPLGWVNYTNLFPGDLVVESWLPSVVWNEPLQQYVMASAGIGNAPDGTEFGKPSYLGIYVSQTPWGPWKQVHEDTAWTPGGDENARAYSPQIAPGWLAPDGKSFWLVWADLAGIREFGADGDLVDAEMAKATTVEERAEVEAGILRRYMPGFSMNAQKYVLDTD